MTKRSSEWSLSMFFFFFCFFSSSLFPAVLHTKSPPLYHVASDKIHRANEHIGSVWSREWIWNLDTCLCGQIYFHFPSFFYMFYGKQQSVHLFVYVSYIHCNVPAGSFIDVFFLRFGKGGCYLLIDFAASCWTCMTMEYNLYAGLGTVLVLVQY